MNFFQCFFEKKTKKGGLKSEKALPLYAEMRPLQMKRFVLYVQLCLIMVVPSARADNGRHLFTDGWTLNGTPVTLPHVVNEKEHSSMSLDLLNDTIALFEKHFDWNGNPQHKLFVEFEGVSASVVASLNGQLLGRHERNLNAFGFDLTPYLNVGDNLLSVSLVNDRHCEENVKDSVIQCDGQQFSSLPTCIIQRVWTYETDLLHQTLPLYSSFGTVGPYIYADDFDIPSRSAIIHYDTEVINEDSLARTFYLRAEVYDAEGKLFTTLVEGMPHTLEPGDKATLFMSSREENVHFWSEGYGYLYTVNLKLVESDNPWAPGDIESTDMVTVRTGFRKVELLDSVVCLNDSVRPLQCFVQRVGNEWPVLGMDVPEWLIDYDHSLMASEGVNLVRSEYTIPSESYIESCDRVGMLQMLSAEDSERNAAVSGFEQKMDFLRDAIIRHRNNPSILCYDCGNQAFDDVYRQQINTMRDVFDPYGGRVLEFGQIDVPVLTPNSLTCQTDSQEAVCLDTAAISPSPSEEIEGRTPHRLILTPIINPQGFRADGRDVALVQIGAVDKKGLPCPLDYSEMECTIKGPAEWKGEAALPMKAGETCLLLRSSTTPGKVRLTVKIKGLPKATLKLNSLKADSVILPLPCRLGCGENPSTQTISPVTAMISHTTDYESQEFVPWHEFLFFNIE